MAIVCTLPEGERAQRRAEIQALLETRTASTKLNDGIELEFSFSEPTARGLLEFVFFERSCCQSFRYEISFPPSHQTVTLRMRAPVEQVEALQAIYC